MVQPLVISTTFLRQIIALLLYRLLLVLMIIYLLSASAYAQRSTPKVVMISLDGTPDYLLDRFLKDGTLPSDGAFAKIRKNGMVAEAVLPVNVASTGPSHLSIFTGASPAMTGIVGNSFRSIDQPWSSPLLTAFDQPIAAETIFQAAMRQRKKVITLNAVGVDQTNPERSADYVHVYPSIVGPSLVLDLSVTDSVALLQGEIVQKMKVSSNSPSKAVFEIFGKQSLPLEIFQQDTVIDQANILVTQNQWVVRILESAGKERLVKIRGDQWSPLSLSLQGKQYVVSFRLLSVNEKDSTIRLFMSAPAEVEISPSNFSEKVLSVVGLWPGEPENRKQTAGLIPEQVWFEQLDRLALYSKKLILAGMQEKDWDLLFGYFSTLDDVQHRYTLFHPKQLDYTADQGRRPAIYLSYLKRYFQLIDQYLLEIMDQAPTGTNFVFFSDHGIIPIHTTVMLSNYLEYSGYAISKQAIKTASSGNAAHIYINRAQLDSSSYSIYINQLQQVLRSFKDSSTGQPVFQLIADHRTQKKYGLYHPTYSGDLFVSCHNGYSISDRFLPEVPYLVQNSFDPSLFSNATEATRKFLVNGTMNETGRAVHGCLSTVREGQSIFYSIGPDIPKKRIKKISALQIAPTIAAILGIQAPKDVEGKSIY